MVDILAFGRETDLAGSCEFGFDINTNFVQNATEAFN